MPDHHPDDQTTPPAAGRPVWVVVPARNEEERIAAAIDALDTAARLAPGPVHLVIVDDGSTDATAAITQAKVATWASGSANLLPGPAAGAGWARRIGLDHALAAAGAADASGPLIATTDADSRVPARWFTALCALADRGHEVIAGDVRLDRDADPQLAEARERRVADRLAEVRLRDPRAEHPHFAGANLAWTAAALAALTPLPTPASLEDDALRERCESLGMNIIRDASFPVVTSPRTVGRAALGLAAALAADAQRLGLEPSLT